MILDLERFIREERPYWEELERWVGKMERDPAWRPGLEEAERGYYLYERAAAGLGKIRTFSAEPGTRLYLEHLVARVHGEIHEVREVRVNRKRIWGWIWEGFPAAFRRRLREFQWAALVFVTGSLLGVVATRLDPESRRVTMPFGHAEMTPSERVAREERQKSEISGREGRFSGMLMTNNIRVSIWAMALGITGGVGTVVSLFYNGVILGAIGWDYWAAGQGRFLAGWLLPHGAVEIPALLIAGQAGLVLGGALLNRGAVEGFRRRMAAVRGDLVSLVGGSAVLLVWAGLVEGFFSQYHEPVLPYEVKIGFGVVEMAALTAYLMRSKGERGRA